MGIKERLMASDDPITKSLKKIEKDLNRAINERRSIQKTAMRWRRVPGLLIVVIFFLLVLF